MDRDASCDHGYPLEGPPWPPCGCRPVVCVVCRRQMFYDGDPRHEPESTLRKSNTLTESHVHDRCIGIGSTQPEDDSKTQNEESPGQASSPSSESGSVDWTVEAEEIGRWVIGRAPADVYRELVKDITALALRAYQKGREHKDLGTPKQ